MEERNGLGELPKGWAWAKLEQCVDILDGRRVPVNAEEREKRIAGKSELELVPYYGATGQVGWIDDYLFDEDLLLLGEDGAPFLESGRNKAYTIRGKTWVNNHAHVLRALEGIALLQLLCYYLNKFDYHQYVTGTTRLKLPQGPMRKIPVPLPPLNEQQRIVAKVEELFSDLDAGVAELEKAKAQLKRYRQAVLKAAVEGKLTAEWREANNGKIEPASVLLERIREERAKSGNGKEKGMPPVNAEELGELPEGWEWDKLQALAANEPNAITDGPFGSNLKTEHYTDEGPRVIRLQNIGDGVFVNADAHISEEHFRKLRKHEIFEGDLVVAGLGESLPRSCTIPGYVGKAIVKADCIRFKPEYKAARPSYLNIALNSERLKKIAKEIVHGVGRPRLNLQQIKSLPIPIPSVEEQDEIIAEVERRLSVEDEIAKTVDASLKQAERLRQSILKRAFEGKLVAQDPSDEPAERLLQRIREAKNLTPNPSPSTMRGEKGKKVSGKQPRLIS